MKIHTQKFVQYCHYYNNDKFCPYEDLDCKFLHQVDNDCKFGKKCNLKGCVQKDTQNKNWKIMVIQKLIQLRNT